jgi:hypothetical protein
LPIVTEIEAAIVRLGRRYTAEQWLAEQKPHHRAARARRWAGHGALPMSRTDELAAIRDFIAMNGVRRFVHVGKGEWRMVTVRPAAAP